MRAAVKFVGHEPAAMNMRSNACQRACFHALPVHCLGTVLTANAWKTCWELVEILVTYNGRNFIGRCGGDSLVWNQYSYRIDA